jgi:hypothetical protein
MLLVLTSLLQQKQVDGGNSYAADQQACRAPAAACSSMQRHLWCGVVRVQLCRLPSWVHGWSFSSMQMNTRSCTTYGVVVGTDRLLLAR